MSKGAKIIISGGGTGGHIYPAVAIANELKAKDPGIEILFVGAEGKMEMEKVPKAGYKIIGLPIAGFNRSNMLANLGLPFKLLRSLWKTYQIIKDFKPDAAIGVGGYASGPTLIMANFLNVPTLIQEQNSFAGVTNKNLAKKARKICVAYPGMERFFPKEKIVLTGNPVRKDILETASKRQQALAHFKLNDDRKVLLIIGGSQGARTINESILAGLNDLISNDLQIIWQTGKLFIDKARAAVDALQTSRVYVSDFIYEMDLAYAAADLVVSRAGALSVSELCLTAKPSILVPFPAAAEDHQTHNALNLVNANAAWCVKDAEAREKLVDQVIALADDPKTMNELSRNIKTLGKPNAGQEIAEEVLALI
ncbi:undecaprenyldiphospho-muramoylpentapeptide beta-N-acetylglucosaminyltransferase [Emticicia sp. TH156]|uniref:undecaprenyldiphospho-muramoylpentapeptide beta-N-acetylglucosaminyltransferase n=1 Tax=Emticicia sp. TH156 TaxID=2067454 RepID=UPI000C78C588|nr:undecaprenyldiphospho-muramoylpentapeptide beta-N-acetylglucosaminyltransferase [Emticicia sp. TH156]PLK45981.1 undecaprenyldiphospho-muramoylpentapeptide beta-N-acetylglucosaminyltransferase [Emticicia sp. TH156]